MPISVDGLSLRVKSLHSQVKQFITDQVAPIEKEYVQHSKSANKWKVFQPIEDLKASIYTLLCFRYISESRCLLGPLHRRSKFANFCYDLMQNHLS